MRIRNVKPTQLKSAKYNPPSRTNPKKLKQLKESIKQHGILVPILVDKSLNIIDGHRRNQSAKELKKATVPILVVDTKLTTNEQFENINSTSRKITSGDMIFIYLNEGKVPKRIELVINEIEKLIGRTNLRKLGDASLSTHILNQAKQIAKYCRDKNNQAFIGQIIMWIFNNKQSYQIRKAMENGVKIDVIKDAITKNKSLKQTWTA